MGTGIGFPAPCADPTLAHMIRCHYLLSESSDENSACLCALCISNRFLEVEIVHLRIEVVKMAIFLDL